MMREGQNWDTLHVRINDENSKDEEFSVQEAFFNKQTLNQRCSHSGAIVSLAEHIQTLTEFVPCRNLA